MYWILPLALFSFFSLDHSIARLLCSLSIPKWPLHLVGFLFQPFIQFIFFTCMSFFNTTHLLYRKMLINCVLTICLVTILKVLIARARPHVALLGYESFKPISLDFTYHSLPSSHAVMGFSLFVTLYSLYPKLYTPLLVLAIVVCITRMLLGLHFLSDCLFGAFLGLIIPDISQKILTFFLNTKKR